MKTNRAFSAAFKEVSDAMHQPTTPEGMAFYFKALEPFPESECVEALRWCAMQSTAKDFMRMPTPGDIAARVRAARRDKDADAAEIDDLTPEEWEASRKALELIKQAAAKMDAGPAGGTRAREVEA